VQGSDVALNKIRFMKKLLFYSQAILIVCVIGLFIAGCSKTGSISGDLVLEPSIRTGIIDGSVSPAESNAVVFISNGFFNGREIIFDASVETDPLTGYYVIKDIPLGTYTLEAIPTNPDYMGIRIQDVVINPCYSNPGSSTCVNIYLLKK